MTSNCPNKTEIVPVENPRRFHKLLLHLVSWQVGWLVALPRATDMLANDRIQIVSDRRSSF